MSSEYYIQNDRGAKFDRAMLEQVETIVAGQGDGRIAVDDCEALFTMVADAGKYTDTEKKTMRHIRNNYEFTDAADEKFRFMIRSWAAKRGWKTRIARMEAEGHNKQ